MPVARRRTGDPCRRACPTTALRSARERGHREQEPEARREEETDGVPQQHLSSSMSFFLRVNTGVNGPSARPVAAKTARQYVTDVTRQEAVDEQTLVGNCGRRRGRGISR